MAEALNRVASALAQLSSIGVDVTLRHGAVITAYGFVLPGENPGEWVSRMKVNDPALVPRVIDSDED